MRPYIAGVEFASDRDSIGVHSHCHHPSIYERALTSSKAISIVTALLEWPACGIGQPTPRRWSVLGDGRGLSRKHGGSGVGYEAVVGRIGRRREQATVESDEVPFVVVRLLVAAAPGDLDDARLHALIMPFRRRVVIRCSMAAFDDHSADFARAIASEPGRGPSDREEARWVPRANRLRRSPSTPRVTEP